MFELVPLYVLLTIILVYHYNLTEPFNLRVICYFEIEINLHNFLVGY